MIEIRVIKKADDISLGEKVLRASLGGSPTSGYYVVYRGNIKEIIKLTEDCLKAMKAIEDKEPAISPDNGKKYA